MGVLTPVILLFYGYDRLIFNDESKVFCHER